MIIWQEAYSYKLCNNAPGLPESSSSSSHTSYQHFSNEGRYCFLCRKRGYSVVVLAHPQSTVVSRTWKPCCRRQISTLSRSHVTVYDGEDQINILPVYSHIFQAVVPMHILAVKLLFSSGPVTDSADHQSIYCLDALNGRFSCNEQFQSPEPLPNISRLRMQFHIAGYRMSSAFSIYTSGKNLSLFAVQHTLGILRLI